MKKSITRKYWTQQELETVKKKYENTRTIDLANELCRPVSQIYQAGKRLGIKRDKSYLKELAKNLAESGKANRFKKGDSPHNKGKKQVEFMSPEAIARTVSTRFKKGQVPHNAKDTDGAISIRKDNKGKSYQYIRIALGKWELLQRVEWEKYNGKIPPGMVIIFKDGNYSNCHIENLQMLTMAENLERNQDKHNNYDSETKRAIKLINKINKKVKNYGKESTKHTGSFE